MATMNLIGHFHLKIAWWSKYAGALHAGLQDGNRNQIAERGIGGGGAGWGRGGGWLVTLISAKLDMSWMPD